MPVRIDDYPHGSREMYQSKPPEAWRNLLGKVLEVFELCEVPYILGASPFLLQEVDISWLNAHIHIGSVVMHGFDHHWSWPQPWQEVVNTWPRGGEYEGKSTAEIQRAYNRGARILADVRRYDPCWFIPSFNVYTQELLDVLQGTPVEHLCGVDTMYKEYNYAALNHGRLKLHNAQYNVSYAGIGKVLRSLSDIHSQITLHWIFDVQRPTVVEEYRRLAEVLREGTHV